MKYTPEQLTAAKKLVDATEQRIKSVYGMDIRVIMVGHDLEMKPDDLCNIVCNTLGLHRNAFKVKSRKEYLVDARFICTILLLHFFKRMTLKEIGELFNQDHTSIMHSRDRANELLKTNEAFKDKYNQAYNAIIKWIEE